MATNRKKEIIRTAQKVFASKGIEKSNISEIAQQVGIADSIIYHYFKNKEDLLFCALSDKIIDVGEELALHLEGILTPEAQLGKMIWYHLYINDLARSETKILKNLLLECRSNIKFYSHHGYQELRKYTKIMSDIIQQGVDDNVFRNDLNLVLVTNMIFGLLDEVSLNSLAAGEIDKTLPDFQDIMNLVFRIISCEYMSMDKKNNKDDNKEAKILKAAVSVFSEKGYRSSTLAQIAQAANVAEGTIYTYFDNKRDLLFSVPKKRFKWLRDNMGQVFNIEHPVMKLRRFMHLFCTTFMADRDLLRIFLIDIKLNKNFYVSPVYKDYVDFVSIIETVLEEGKERGVFNKNINNRIFKNFFLGSFMHLATRWLVLGEKKTIDIMQDIEEMITLLCRAAKPESQGA